MGSVIAAAVPGSTPLNSKQQHRLGTANLVLAKLAALQVRNYMRNEHVATIKVSERGDFYFCPADPELPKVRMDAYVKGKDRIWPLFRYTRHDMAFLRALAVFVLEGRKVPGKLLATVIVVNFNQDTLAPVICRYDAVVSAFRFAAVFSDTEQVNA